MKPIFVNNVRFGEGTIDDAHDFVKDWDLLGISFKSLCIYETDTIRIDVVLNFGE